MDVLSSQVKLAEAVGFEPTMPLRACLISSQVHSTALPCLRNATCASLAARLLVSGPT